MGPGTLQNMGNMKAYILSKNDRSPCTVNLENAKSFCERKTKRIQWSKSTHTAMWIKDRGRTVTNGTLFIRLSKG